MKLLSEVELWTLGIRKNLSLHFLHPPVAVFFGSCLCQNPALRVLAVGRKSPKQEILTRPCRRKLPAKSVGSVAYNAAIGACGYAHSAERARVLRSGAVVHVEILLSAKRSPTSWLSQCHILPYPNRRNEERERERERQGGLATDLHA